MHLYSGLSHSPWPWRVVSHQKGSVWRLPKAGKAGGWAKMNESFAVPITSPIQGTWDKWMGPGTPGPFEQECWACGLKRDRDHQDFTRLYQDLSDDHHVGLGPGKVKKHSRVPGETRTVPSGQEGTTIREPLFGPTIYLYSHGFLLMLAKNLQNSFCQFPLLFPQGTNHGVI